MINGHGPFKVFYDTGAAVNILNPEVISQLDLPSSNFAGSIHGLNGGPIDTKPFHATELRIGDLALRDQDFYNVPMPLPKSYGIAQDFSVMGSRDQASGMKLSIPSRRDYRSAA